jgi:hypothetical protein
MWSHINTSTQQHTNTIINTPSTQCHQHTRNQQHSYISNIGSQSPTPHSSTPKHQHTNTPTRQHASTQTHQLPRAPTHQHTNQHTNTPTHQHTNPRSHQHSVDYWAIFSKVLVLRNCAGIRNRTFETIPCNTLPSINKITTSWGPGCAWSCFQVASGVWYLLRKPCLRCQTSSHVRSLLFSQDAFPDR